MQILHFYLLGRVRNSARIQGSILAKILLNKVMRIQVDSNYMVSFQIPSHGLNLEIWKEAYSHYMYMKVKNIMDSWCKGAHHQNNVHAQKVYVYVQWLLFVTATLHWLTTLHILQIWDHLPIFWSPIWNKQAHTLASEALSNPH